MSRGGVDVSEVNGGRRVPRKLSAEQGPRQGGRLGEGSRAGAAPVLTHGRLSHSLFDSILEV